MQLLCRPQKHWRNGGTTPTFGVMFFFSSILAPKGAVQGGQMTFEPTLQPAELASLSPLPPPCRDASSVAAGTAPPPEAVSHTCTHTHTHRQTDRAYCHCTRPLISKEGVAGFAHTNTHTDAHTPLLSELPLPLALLLFLPLQLLPELLALAVVVLASLLVCLQQLCLVQGLQLVQLLFVFGNELLDLRLQT